MRSESFRKGVKDGIPIGLGYFAVSFTFGMMAVADGLSIWQAVLISLTNVTSAGQFAGLEIMVMSGSYWEMALTQLIINLRYCLMSFSLAQKFRRDESLVHRYIAAFGVTDEIFVCLSHSRAVPHRYDLLNQSIRKKEGINHPI